MRTVRLPLTRGALFIIALAAISILLARGDNPAQATSFEPVNSVRVSDPTPGASADIIIDFSIDKPDSFPNLKANPAIQFLPRQWDIAAEAKIGAIGGTFNTLSTLGLMGASPCGYQLPVNFTMIDATTDTGYDEVAGAYDPEKLASSLDLGGDYHPGGPGFSGQFVDDPNTLEPPGDLNLPLINFKVNVPGFLNEKQAGPGSWWGAPFELQSVVYRDVDGSNNVSAGDLRLTDDKTLDGGIRNPAGVVDPGDSDIGRAMVTFRANEKHLDPDGNGQYDPGEGIYRDVNQAWLNTVTYGDIRLYWFAHMGFGSTVADFALPGGVSRYPDFLNQIFQMFGVVGDPLARQFGAQDVLGNPVPLNLVTFRPGQLPGYPATLGYPTVVVLLNPVAPIDASIINLTSDLCTPLSLTSTNFGVTRDNPATTEDESGRARLTNPAGPGEKEHKFTLVVASQPDADGDGIENMLDSCPLDPNIQDLDGRAGSGSIWDIDIAMDPDLDGLDGACDQPNLIPYDFGRALVPFNSNEKYIGYPTGTNWWVYRDNGGSGNITPGDDRLMTRRMWWSGGWHYLPPGVVLDSDGDYRDPATGNVRPAWDRRLNSFTGGFAGIFKHAENVAANGLYDAGEDVYRDEQHFDDNEVNLGDYRKFFEGRNIEGFGQVVLFKYASPLGPFFYNVDEDQDNYGNRADNCSTIPNGIEVVGMTYVQLRGLVFNLLTVGDLVGPDNQLDTDLDDIGDACEGAEHGDQCANDLDDDGDGVVNDGCTAVLTPGVPESGGECANDIDDDMDGLVNDGCPADISADIYPEWNCLDALDDDGDGWVNEGCPTNTASGPETGDQCANDTDDDGDYRVNDGCPVLDAAGERFIPTGHIHVETLVQKVKISKHGVKLNNLGGPSKVSDGGARTYSVDVSNLSGSDSEDVQVALQVLGGCGTVNGAPGQNTAVVSVAPGDSGTAEFTVDWTNCLPGLDPDPYVLKADACHAGDPEPAGFFGVGACPGASDGRVDPNLTDDVYMTMDVEVGTP